MEFPVAQIVAVAKLTPNTIKEYLAILSLQASPAKHSSLLRYRVKRNGCHDKDPIDLLQRFAPIKCAKTAHTTARLL